MSRFSNLNVSKVLRRVAVKGLIITSTFSLVGCSINNQKTAPDQTETKKMEQTLPEGMMQKYNDNPWFFVEIPNIVELQKANEPYYKNLPDDIKKIVQDRDKTIKGEIDKYGFNHPLAVEEAIAQVNLCVAEKAKYIKLHDGKLSDPESIKQIDEFMNYALGVICASKTQVKSEDAAIPDTVTWNALQTKQELSKQLPGVILDVYQGTNDVVLQQK